MQYDHLSIDGQRVAYTNSGGDGPAVLLIHGNSSSSRTFQPQLESELGRAYRMVAIDLPGFGDSQPIADAASGLGIQGYGRLVAKVVDALQLRDVVLVGWSLGGHVALEAVEEIPGCKGVLIYGAPPLAFPPDMAAAFLPNPAMGAAFNPQLSEAEMHGFVQAFFAPGYVVDDDRFMEDIRRADGSARAAIAASIRPGGYKDEVQVVANLRTPLAVLHGAQEQLINGAYFDALTMPTLWRGAVQVIADAGHAPHWETPSTFNALLGDFLADCTG
ncbi:MAG: alpha/beta hydrolase [Chloroflexota bacterium]|nr:alpha/beta hydrolase [Caldilinea sp.]GIK71957.1 MAG: alpha/beta hydrolase [Chloroflexota bacterium]